MRSNENATRQVPRLSLVPATPRRETEPRTDKLLFLEGLHMMRIALRNMDNEDAMALADPVGDLKYVIRELEMMRGEGVPVLRLATG